MTELTIEEIEKASAKELIELANLYQNNSQTHFATLIKNVANEKAKDELIAQKYQAKQKASERGDFKAFTLISQDIREIERKTI